jgi:hypothetical protein
VALTAGYDDLLVLDNSWMTKLEIWIFQAEYHILK